MVAAFLRLWGKRDPQVGELYWVEDSVFGFVSSAERHPVVVIGGSNLKGGPVRVAQGSSNYPDEPGMPILRVGPNETEPPNALSKAETKFYFHRAERINVKDLGRRIGKLSAAKMEELRALKRSVL